MKKIILLGLLLSFNTWAVDSDTKQNIAGRWEGELSGLTSPFFHPPIPCGIVTSKLSFTQNKSLLNGKAIFSGGCYGGFSWQYYWRGKWKKYYI